MRVLFVINSLIPAGAEALTRDLAIELRKTGIDSSVAVLKELNSAFEDDLRRAGVPLIELSKSGIYSVLQVPALRQTILKYDVIHAHLFPASLWLAIAAGPRVALVVSEHGTHNRRREKPWLRRLDKWMYSRFSRIVCASSAIRQALIEWTPSVADRTELVPNGIDVAKFEIAAAVSISTIAKDCHRPTAIAVSRFEPYKDHATLLRAVAHVPDMHLLWAGDGPLRLTAEALATSLGIRERVHFLGRRSDIPSLLKSGDFFIQSSHTEGFGIATVEAMAAGLPVIATDIAGLNEVVRGTGLLVSHADAAALAATIRSLIGSPEKRQELSRRSQLRAREFSIQRCASAHLEIYEKVLRERSVR